MLVIVLIFPAALVVVLGITHWIVTIRYAAKVDETPQRGHQAREPVTCHQSPCAHRMKAVPQPRDRLSRLYCA